MRRFMVPPHWPASWNNETTAAAMVHWLACVHSYANVGAMSTDTLTDLYACVNGSNDLQVFYVSDSMSSNVLVRLKALSQAT